MKIDATVMRLMGREDDDDERLFNSLFGAGDEGMIVGCESEGALN